MRQRSAGTIVSTFRPTGNAYPPDGEICGRNTDQKTLSVIGKAIHKVFSDASKSAKDRQLRICAWPGRSEHKQSDTRVIFSEAALKQKLLTDSLN
jgi:hypothetical protein